MEPRYAKQYGELYRRHWWWRAREEALVKVLRRRRVRLDRRLLILDIGCGNGLFFESLAEFGDVEGIEPDATLIDPGGKHRSQIHVVPLDKSFHPQKRYDLVLMLDVLEHLDNPKQGLECVRELLQDGGALLITVPAFQSLWTRHDDANQHRIRYRRRTLFPLLRQAGFSILESKYWYQWILPMKLATRIAEKIIPTKPLPPRIPPRWLNQFLYRFSRLEQESLGSTAIPFGSSLMVFCTKDDSTCPAF